jgi:cell division protein FtsB
VIVALVVSYVGPIHGVLTQRAELKRQQDALAAMIAEREAIQAQRESLDDPAVIEARARQLGYARPGEIPYRVSGLEPPPQPAVHRDDSSFWDFLPDLF